MVLCLTSMGGSKDDKNLHMLSVWVGERWLMMLGAKLDEDASVK